MASQDEAATVLVVDDNELIRDLIVAVAGAAGFATQVAASGREAIERFRAHADTIGCAILDLSLPDMSGVQTLDRLRKTAPAIPAVIVSAHADAVVCKAIGDRDGVAFVQKPFDAAKLIETMHALMGSAAASG